MNQAPRPSDPHDSPGEVLAKLLAEGGIHLAQAHRAIEQLFLLAKAVAPPGAVARAIDSGVSLGSAHAARSTPQAWLARLIASLDEAADALAGALSGGSQPIVVGVRRASDPDRFRVDRIIGPVSIGIDCERLSQSAGWRLVGHVGGDDAPPAEICVQLSRGGIPVAVVGLDEFSMFEFTLPPGTYTVALTHEAQEAPLLASLDLP